MQEKIDNNSWGGDAKPYNASYGKLMMWFFLITDALTFSAFLVSYGFSRFKYEDIWPVPEDVLGQGSSLPYGVLPNSIWYVCPYDQYRLTHPSVQNVLFYLKRCF